MTSTVPTHAPEAFAKLLMQLLGSEETSHIALDIGEAMLSPGGPRPPARGETAAVALYSPKIAALCFDRIWSSSLGDLPQDLTFCGGSDAERRLVVHSFVIDVLLAAAQQRLTEAEKHLDATRKRRAPWWRISSLFGHRTKAADSKAGALSTLEDRAADLRETIEILKTATTDYFSWAGADVTSDGAILVRAAATKAITDSLLSDSGIVATPVYDNALTRDREYVAGDR